MHNSAVNKLTRIRMAHNIKIEFFLHMKYLQYSQSQQWEEL